MIAFLASFFFLNLFFDFYPALLGAVSYITSLYIAVEIFVRGNLGEIWFLSLFPLVFYFLYKNAKNKNHKIFFFTTIILSFVFSTHNVLSLIFIPIGLIYIWILKGNIRLNFFAFVLGLILCSYFILPALLEVDLTHAKQIASTTDFRLHFLCPSQLWQSPWGYGGSTAGCLKDGMSFKIGKIQLIFALSGAAFLILRKKRNPTNLFFLFLTLISLFLTTYQSQFIWGFFSPVFSYFQFPWRFIAFSLLGISFLVSFFWQNFIIKFRSWFVLFFIFYLLVYSSYYFTGKLVVKNDFKKKYLSISYIEKQVAYKVTEYLPKIVDYQYWIKFNSGQKKFIPLNFNYHLPAEVSNDNLTIIKNTPWQKEFSVKQTNTIHVNIHYFPFWKIIVNGKKIVPQQFDLLGRPIINISKQSVITLIYEQTIIEKLGNFLTILSFGLLAFLVINKKIWNKVLNYLT
jgi:hypothetical protein